MWCSVLIRGAVRVSCHPGMGRGSGARYMSVPIRVERQKARDRPLLVDTREIITRIINLSRGELTLETLPPGCTRAGVRLGRP